MASDLLFPPCGDLKREVPAMRKINTTSLLPALLCGAALLAFGCDRGGESHAGQVQNPAPAPSQSTQPPGPPPAPGPRPQVNELTPRPPQQVPAQPRTPRPAAARERP